MADILDYLKQIANSIYGKDVRSSIVNAIRQCYDDGKAGATDLLARERISNLTKLAEGSTTGDAELADLRVGVDGKTYPNAGDAVREQISELKGDLDENSSIININLGKLDKVFFNTISVFTQINHSYDFQGALQTYNGWNSTDFIDIEGYKKFRYKLTGYNNNTVKLNTLSFFDENKMYIDGYFTPTWNTGSQVTGEIDVPNNAKYVVCLNNADNVSGEAYLIGLPQDGEIQTELKNHETRITALEERYLDDVTVMCIGDSLTEGFYASTQSVNEHNYPFFAHKHFLYPNTFINRGYSGLNSVSIWNNHRTDIDVSNVDIVVMCLGTNGGYTSNPQATIDSEVVPYTDFNDFGDSPEAKYCALIEYMYSQNPNVAIILCIPPYVNGSKSDSARSCKWAVDSSKIAIPIIAKRYNLPIINLYDELGINSINTDALQGDGVHFDYNGYSKLGTFIASKLNSLCNYII